MVLLYFPSLHHFTKNHVMITEANTSRPHQADSALPRHADVLGARVEDLEMEVSSLLNGRKDAIHGRTGR